MGRGSNITKRVDIIDSYDPRVTGRAAPKGTLFRYIPAVGSPVLLIKDDDGFTTNWIDASGGSSPAYSGANLGAGAQVFKQLLGFVFQYRTLVQGTNITITENADEIVIDAAGGAPTGDINTIAFFDAAGNLDSNVDARFDSAIFAMGFAELVAGGVLTPTGAGSFTHGHADNGGSLVVTGGGAQGFGYVTGSGVLTSSGPGSLAFGLLVDPGAIMSATSSGSFVFGVAATDGTMYSEQEGSLAFGKSTGTGSIIRATVGGTGAAAFGYSRQGGIIESFSNGSVAFGYANGSGSRIYASGEGSHARGLSNQDEIVASGNGSSAIGFSTNGLVGTGIHASSTGSWAQGFTSTSNLDATNEAAHASGRANANATILASGVGSFARGVADSATVSATGTSSAVFGYAVASGQVISSGTHSFVHGFSQDALELMNGSGDYSFSSGQSLLNSIYLCAAFGRFADIVGTANAWVATELLFVLGNGIAGAPANALEVYKDGKIRTTGAQRHSACRSVSADTTLSARTDRTLFVDTAAAAGNVTVTFPAGEDGLEYFVKDSGANAAVNNILFTPDGADTVEAGADITTNSGARHFQFFGGVWYVMN